MLSPLKIEKIKAAILGKKYSLSVAFVTPAVSHQINKKYRKKDKPTNVLSFALRPTVGELVLCKAVIKKEAKKLERNETDWLIFLVIHGMLHLKGMTHGSIMEKAEIKYGKKYIGSNRHWLENDTSRGGRIRQGGKIS
jgi:rRNA maturation RNase YbeY